MKNQIKYTFFFIIYLYIFIYAPVIRYIPVPTPLFLLPITYYFLLKNKARYQNFFILFQKELIILFLLLIYVFLYDLAYGRNVYFTAVFYYIFEVLPTSFIIVVVFCKNADRDSFYRLIIFVGTIAALISVLSFGIPLFNNIITSLQKEIPVTADISLRNYGFASGLLFSYPVGQGVIGVVCLLMLQNNKKYIIPFFIILISIIINARTGLLPIILYFAYKFVRFNLKTLVYSSLIVFTFIVANSAGLFAPIQELIDWNLILFYDIRNYFFADNGKYDGGGQTFFDFIIDNFLVFPQNTFGWIFGEHREVFEDPIKNSDIGYINDLIYGGLILVGLILLFFIRISKQLMKINYMDSRFIAYLFLATYLFANIKGEFFRPNSGTRVLILMFVYYLYNFTKYNGKEPYKIKI